MEAIEKYINILTDFLGEHQAIIDCHMVDFLWANHWENILPNALREELEENITDIMKNIHVILSGSSCGDYRNLGNFLRNAKKHSLEEFSECGTLENLMPNEAIQSLRVVDCMSPKKQHEVKLVSNLISWLCRESTSAVVVDTGDGKGYLSTCLAFEHHLPVIGLEANADYQRSAQKRVSKLKKKWNPQGGIYRSLAVTVKDDLCVRDICVEVFPEIKEPQVCLSGLHTCGDLAVSCLEIFVRDPSIESLCNIGCCYNLLTKFPVSTYVSTQNFTLSDKAKMLACQSLNSIIQNDDLPKDSLHFRTLFEKLVREKYPCIEFQNLGKTKSENFINYFKESCEKIALEPWYTDDELQFIYDGYDRKRLDLFYLLRSSLAPVIEAVILLDRILFLHEMCNCSVNLLKLFKPEISPRCYAIVAKKNIAIKIMEHDKTNVV